MIDERKNKILKANILFLFLGFILFYFGSRAQSKEIYSGILITEYIIILVPNILYLKLKGFSLKETLRLKKISIKQSIYIVFITLFSYPVAVFLNNLMLVILNFFGEAVPNAVPIPETPKQYLLSIIVLAISPGICEEIMFRGTIMDAYDSLGKKRAIIFSAILFGLLHLNIFNLVGPIFLGIIFGIVVYKTNSIYSSILGHILNNGIAMTIGYFVLKAQQGVGEATAYEISFRIQLIIALIFTSIIAIGSGFILVKLIRKLPESREEEIRSIDNNDFKFTDFIPVFISIVLFIIVNIKYVLI